MVIDVYRLDSCAPNNVAGTRSRRGLCTRAAGVALGAALSPLGIGATAVHGAPAGGRPLSDHAEGYSSRQRIVLAGTELEYEERGAGEPVLLIHGGLLADAFTPVLAQPALTDHYRVISYHRRGYAGSARPKGDVCIARQAADARDLLGHLGIERAHVVGHSYGGAIALQLALDAPAAVHSLALLEPPLFAVPGGEQFVATVFAPAIERYGTGDRAGAVETVLRGVAGETGLAALQRAVPGALELAETDADTFFLTELPALQAWRFGAQEVRRIGQPVLTVRGTDSDAVAPVFGEGIAQLHGWLPHAESLVVPDATHGLPFMNPGGLAEGLTAFFGRHPLAPQSASRAMDGAVKLVALYGPPTDVAAFERYYAETHVPLAHRLPGLLLVETARLLGTAEGDPAPYHRIAELWFADMAQFQAAATSPAGQALAADVPNFATGGVTVLVAQVDVPEAATLTATAAA
jgi:uncharacterized protein (TIGR02118 family)